MNLEYSLHLNFFDKTCQITFPTSYIECLLSDQIKINDPSQQILDFLSISKATFVKVISLFTKCELIIEFDMNLFMIDFCILYLTFPHLDTRVVFKGRPGYYLRLFDLPTLCPSLSFAIPWTPKQGERYKKSF